MLIKKNDSFIDYYCSVQCVLFSTLLQLTHYIQWCVGKDLLCFVLLYSPLFLPVITLCSCRHYCMTWLRDDVMTKSAWPFTRIYFSHSQSWGKMKKDFGKAHQKINKNKSQIHCSHNTRTVHLTLTNMLSYVYKHMHLYLHMYVH